MHGHMMQIFNNLEHTIENKGDSLVITLKGDKEELIKVEKTLKLLKDMKDTMGDDCCGGGCCC